MMSSLFYSVTANGLIFIAYGSPARLAQESQCSHDEDKGREAGMRLSCSQWKRSLPQDSASVTASDPAEIFLGSSSDDPFGLYWDESRQSFTDQMPVEPSYAQDRDAGCQYSTYLAHDQQNEAILDGHDIVSWPSETKTSSLEATSSRDAKRERKRRNDDKHKENIESKETQYYKHSLRTRPKLIRAMVDQLKTLTGLCDKGAKLHLRLNLDEEIESDLLSNDTYRQQRAVHRLDYGILDGIFTKSERRKIRELLSTGQHRKYMPRCLSDAKNLLTTEQKTIIRNTWPKSPSDINNIFEWLLAAYDHKSRKDGENTGRDKDSHSQI